MAYLLFSQMNMTGSLWTPAEVHGLVALSLAGGAVPKVAQHHCIITQPLARQGVAHRLGHTRGHHVGDLDHLVLYVGPLEGELAAPAIYVSLLAHVGEHGFQGGEAGHHLEGQAAIVGEEEAVPVLVGRKDATHLGGLVALAGGYDGHLALAVEGPYALVQGTDGHQPTVEVDHLLVADTQGFVLPGGLPARGGNLSRLGHSSPFQSEWA